MLLVYYFPHSLHFVRKKQQPRTSISSINREIKSQQIKVGLQYFHCVVFWVFFCSLTYFNYDKIFYFSVLEEKDFKRIYPGYTTPTPQEKGTLVKLKGLPFGCTKQDIATFFSGKITITTCIILNEGLFLLFFFFLPNHSCIDDIVFV